MIFEPTEHYRHSLRQGMSGADVWAIQIAVNAAHISANLVEDGAFGPKTDAAVRTLQKSLWVTVDGIIGPYTQATLCARECLQKEKGRTPAGLLKGICFGESGGIIPTTSPAYGDGSRDYGPFQNHMTLTSTTYQQLKESFSPPVEALKLTGSLVAAYMLFKGRVGCPTTEAAWRMAVLNYNWEAAANALSKLQRSEWGLWTYTETGTGVKRRMSDPAPWVEQYGVPNVLSGLDWAGFYVESKVVYVKDWSVA